MVRANMQLLTFAGGRAAPPPPSAHHQHHCAPAHSPYRPPTKAMPSSPPAGVAVSLAENMSPITASVVVPFAVQKLRHSSSARGPRRLGRPDGPGGVKPRGASQCESVERHALEAPGTSDGAPSKCDGHRRRSTKGSPKARSGRPSATLGATSRITECML